MSNYDNSDIINILKDDDKDDIQVINREDYPFDLPLNSPENDQKPIEPTGLTPILAMDEPEDNNFPDNLENQLIAQPKLYLNLPPLPPLSDLVLPNGINIQPLNIDTQNQKKKREPAAPKTRPAFVMKIWSMVNDPSNHQYIRWDESGETFQVFHREEFMKNILPKYFKHNNFASFVRQLNMYGWHKVQDITSGTLKDDKNTEENWKFKNPYFQRGREDLLDNIVRHKAMGNEGEYTENSPNVKLLLSELENIKMNQLAISEDLRRIRKDNKTLWQENYIARERHVKQTQTLDKILKFLATVYGNNNTGKILEVNYDDANNSAPNANTSLNLDTFNDDFNLDDLPGKPKPQLMLMNQAYKSNKTTPNNAGPSPYALSSQTNTPVVEGGDSISGLEHNIYKQGQSIQQVQDWIQKISNQQQAQQQQIQAHQQQIQQSQADLKSGASSYGSNATGSTPLIQMSPGKLDLDFDVNDFLYNNSPANTPLQDEEPKRKRFKTSNIEEINE